MLYHSCLKIVQKLPPSCLQSCPKVVLRLSLSCLKIVFFPTYLQVVSRLSPSGVKGNHSCESTWLIIQSQFTRKGKTIIMATAQSMTNNRTRGKMERKRKKQHTVQQLFEGVEHRWQKNEEKNLRNNDKSEQYFGSHSPYPHSGAKGCTNNEVFFIIFSKRPLKIIFCPKCPRGG